MIDGIILENIKSLKIGGIKNEKSLKTIIYFTNFIICSFYCSLWRKGF